MRVTAQPHRPADACNVLAVGWLEETKESRPWTWRATDLRGRPVRCSEPLPEPHTTHCTEGTSRKQQYWALLYRPESIRAREQLCGFLTSFLETKLQHFLHLEREKVRQTTKRNRRSPWPNSPHPQVPLSMKNGAKLSICKSLMKNKKPPNPIWWLGHLSGNHHQTPVCMSFRGRVCGSLSSSCSPGGTGHWDPLLVMP